MHDTTITNNTLSMREQFVKAALQGLLSNSMWVDTKIRIVMREHSDDLCKAAECLRRELAEDAVEIADATIECLLQPTQQQ